MAHITVPTRKPGDYPRRILLAVSGLSPQIVTETLYAVATDALNPFMPTEVHLITTRKGAKGAELALLSTDMGWFHRLCKDYHFPSIGFTPDHIHVIRDADGFLMDDIRSPEDNHACADFITAKVRALTADTQAALHVSIAGGRKTMGFYLGYALSLYGRPQDRLSHVLVSEPFESSHDFYYPTPYSRVIQFGDKELADTATAKVTLAEIPFVSLRERILPNELLSGQASFSETVAAAQAALAPPSLELDLQGRCIKAGNKIVKLPPAELALLAVFARRAMTGLPALPAPIKDVPDIGWKDRFLEEYQRIVRMIDNSGRTEKEVADGMKDQYFSERKSKLERILRRELGLAARAYKVDDGGAIPYRYSLTLTANAIEFTTGLDKRQKERNP